MQALPMGEPGIIKVLPEKSGTLVFIPNCKVASISWPYN